MSIGNRGDNLNQRVTSPVTLNLSINQKKNSEDFGDAKINGHRGTSKSVEFCHDKEMLSCFLSNSTKTHSDATKSENDCLTSFPFNLLFQANHELRDKSINHQSAYLSDAEKSFSADLSVNVCNVKNDDASVQFESNFAHLCPSPKETERKIISKNSNINNNNNNSKSNNISNGVTAASSVSVGPSGTSGSRMKSNFSAGTHVCPDCSRKFTRSDMLVRHKHVHTGDRPFVCGDCGQKFSRSDHLSTHRRTHTGQRPYSCEHCDYSACRRDMITRHMRVHQKRVSGEDLFCTYSIFRSLIRVPTIDISNFSRFKLLKINIEKSNNFRIGGDIHSCLANAK